MSFRVGDEVYSLRFKTFGKVTKTSNGYHLNSNFTCVYFESIGSISYYNDGRFKIKDTIADIYHGMPEIIAPPEPYRKPNLKNGDRIIVRSLNCDCWKRRIFKEWVDDNARCFIDGGDEWSSSGVTTLWNQWKLPEDE